MATHLGLCATPKGAGTSFAGKTEADPIVGDDGPYLTGIGDLRIERRPTYRAFYALLWAAVLEAVT